MVVLPEPLFLTERGLVATFGDVLPIEPHPGQALLDLLQVTHGDRAIGVAPHQLGLDPRKLEVPGRKRLEIDYGKPIKDIIA